jgi:hypothetical protein
LASFVEVRGCGCVADGAGSVVGGRLVVAQEVDEGFFFGTLVLAWERSQEVLVVVIVIFVVGWECIGVLVAVALATVFGLWDSRKTLWRCLLSR